MAVDGEEGDFILPLAHGLPNSVSRRHINDVEMLTTSVMKRRGCGVVLNAEMSIHSNVFRALRH